MKSADNKEKGNNINKADNKEKGNNICKADSREKEDSIKRALYVRYVGLLVGCMLLLFVGVMVFREKQYAAISMGMVILSAVFLISGFDKRQTHLRRIVLIAVMTALSVIGRVIFAAVPGFKPMMAMIVLTGMYLGGEAGFWCGTCTAVLSNFYFGQGPWTPFQMFAFGFLGLLAGVFHKSLKRNRICLVLYGIFAGILYSFIMDVWNVLWYYDSFEMAAYLTSLMAAIPYTVSYAVSNVVFLLMMKKPFGRKMNRMIVKYGV